MRKKLITLLLASILTVAAIPATTMLAEGELISEFDISDQQAADILILTLQDMNAQAKSIGKYDDKAISYEFSVDPYGAEVNDALARFHTDAENNAGTPIEAMALSWIARITATRAMVAGNISELKTAEAMFLHAASVIPTITDYADDENGTVAGFLLYNEASALRGAMAVRAAIGALERTEADRLYAVAKEFYKAAAANAKLATDKSSEEFKATVEQITATYTAGADEHCSAAMGMLTQSRATYATAASLATQTAELISSWETDFQKGYSGATAQSAEKDAAAHQKLTETADYVWPPK